MVDILVLYDLMEPPVKLMMNFLRGFKAQYGCNLNAVVSNGVTVADLNKCDVLIAIRPQSRFLARICQIVNKSGRIAVALYDDDFLAIKDYHIRRRVQESAVIKVLKNIEVLMSTNEGLLEKYKDIGNVPRCIKMDTAVSMDEIKHISCENREESATEDKTIRVVYYCNDGSTETFEKIIGPMIPHIYSEYGDDLLWTFIGTKPYMDPCIKKENIKLIQHLSLEEFKNELRNGGYSYGMAPLMDNEFSNHKYINKFIEFTSAGIPCIYSDVSPYKEFIRDGVDGYLCNDEMSWMKAMSALRNQDNRSLIVKKAQEKLIEDFSVEGISRRIAEVVPEMCGEGILDKKEIKGIKMILAKIEKTIYRPIDLWCRICGRIKVEGLNSFWGYSIKRMADR